MKLPKIKTRDPLMIAIINGVTKSAVHKDKKKSKSKNQCRKSKSKQDNE